MAKTRDFGAFELYEKLASGGMASVYRGLQKSLSRPVVLKILHPHLAEDEEFVTRFEREAQAAAPLRHENIVQIIDFGRHDGAPFIAMELVDGDDLRRSMEKRGTPPLEIALLVLRGVADGLDYAHRQRLIHRDIKPANVMLARDGSIKLTDFGLAKSTESLTVVTLAGSVLGTPAYMSPEQANGEAADERSDLFSLGVVAYEMLGGTRPFRGADSSAILHAILTVDPPRLETINPTVPEEIADLVRRLLEKDRLHRPASAAVARDEIESVLESLGVRRGRALLVEYFSEPQAVADRLRKSRLERHLSQGIYYETLGLGRIDDAIREYRRVLHLDPKNAQAKDRLGKLERERRSAESSGSSQAAGPARDPEATTVIEDTAETARDPDRAGSAPGAEAGPRRRAGGLRVAGLAAVVLLLAAGGYALLRGRGGPGAGASEEGSVSPLVAKRIENPAARGAGSPPRTSPADSARGSAAREPASEAATPPQALPPPPANASNPSGSPERAAVKAPPVGAVSPPAEARPPLPHATTSGAADGGGAARPATGESTKPREPQRVQPPPQTAPEPAPGIGTIRISSSGTWAYVYLDGRKTGKTTPCVLESISSGEHSLFLVRDGFEMTGGPRTITVEGGKTMQVDVPMRPQ